MLDRGLFALGVAGGAVAVGDAVTGTGANGGAARGRRVRSVSTSVTATGPTTAAGCRGARLYDDHGDVVVTSAGVREIDQLPNGLRGGIGAHDSEDLGWLDEIAQPVGAEDERVPRDVRDRLRADLDLDVVVDAERAGDLVRVRVRRRLIRSEDLRLDHLLDHRVVARDLEDLPLLNEVHAAVADVRDLRAAGVHEHRDDSGTGAPASRGR